MSDDECIEPCTCHYGFVDVSYHERSTRIRCTGCGRQERSASYGDAVLKWSILQAQLRQTVRLQNQKLLDRLGGQP